MGTKESGVCEPGVACDCRALLTGFGFVVGVGHQLPGGWVGCLALPFGAIQGVYLIFALYECLFLIGTDVVGSIQTIGSVILVDVYA